MESVQPVLFSSPIYSRKEFFDGPRGTIPETGERSKKKIKETNVADVKRRIDAGEKFLLVDVREDNEWAKGHLPGAVHMGRGIIERDIEQQVPDTNAKLVLYCGGGFRSALVAKTCRRWLQQHRIDGRRVEGLLEAGCRSCEIRHSLPNHVRARNTLAELWRIYVSRHAMRARGHERDDEKD